MGIVNVKEKLSKIETFWDPKIVAELNGQLVKIAKIRGEFVWHKHEQEDELFYVLKGRLEILFRDRTVVLSPGEMYVVPRGVEHKPVAKEEVHIILFEPSTTLNTGDVVSDMTIKELERI